jgi:hypothetical protein
MRMAYADPPYPGCARKHYGREEVDHRQMLAWLFREFPDGWALSTSSSALEKVLGLTGELQPGRVRVMAWVKPWCVWKQHVNPTYAWEPLLVAGGRPRRRPLPTIRDWLSASIAMRTGCPGAKPPEFCAWLFEVLNLQPGDELVDVFPGSGAVSRAWEEFCGSLGNGQGTNGQTADARRRRPPQGRVARADHARQKRAL